MAIHIPINDLRRHNSAISQEIEGAIARTLARGWYILGPEVKRFEEEWASYCNVAYCTAVGNGTDALEIALRALGVEPGEQVATVANAGMYSTTAIRAIGAEPLYVDVDPVTMTMDPRSLASALTHRTRAVIVTHLYGQMADMPALLGVANHYGVSVIEDCAQAHGACLQGKPAGSWGDLGCFSFYPTKNLGALGDAGALVTKDAMLADRAYLLRQYGWTEKYRSALPGGRNSRLDELQAAVLLAKLPYLGLWNERRRCIASTYTSALEPLGLLLPKNPNTDYVAHLYVLRTPDRDSLRSSLAARGISAEIHYPIPDHCQESVKRMASVSWSLPETERCSREILTLPCFPEMSDSEVQLVIEAVRSWHG